MANPFATKSFKKTHSEWMKKLKDDGFNDIEAKDISIAEPEIANILIVESTQIYIQWACDMAHNGCFRSEKDRALWEMHAAGQTCGEISKETSVDRTWIARKIKKIRSQLKAQEYPLRSVLPYIIST